MEKVILLFALMALVNFAFKVSPVFCIAGRTLPKFLDQFLRNTPIPVITALLCSELIHFGAQQDFALDHAKIFATVPSFIVGIFSKSIFLTMLAGVITVAIFRHF